MSPSQPVIVLVHGAWADASSWTSAFTEPSGPPAWKTIPSWAVIGTGDQVIPPAELTFMAKRAGAHITDVNAGHLSLVSEPSVVIGVILHAVQATG
jgi:pimeloyl-ACP methyl ester carboxylesterase